MDTVPNEALHLEDLPSPDASWPEIWRLANSFNGYTHWGSFKACAAVANQKKDSTLTELRTCLFFECRRWHHYGDTPDEDESVYIREVVAKIVESVADGRLD